MNNIISNIAVLSVLGAVISAHMVIESPTPRVEANGGADMKRPMGSVGSIVGNNIPPGLVNGPNGTPSGRDGDLPICKSDKKSPIVEVKAGEPLKVKFLQNNAAHSGGHCEFSLSYDNGKEFVVIHQVLKTCFKKTVPPVGDGNLMEVSEYDIPFPADLPSGEAIFSWTWVNASGNREFYMNCIDVKITGKEGGSYKGKKMLIVNHPSLGTNVIPEFGGNYETGLDLYKAQPEITVTANGTSGGSGG
ncbi:hypothetical protein EV182_007197, partial [Spiromyces aspiralis]